MILPSDIGKIPSRTERGSVGRHYCRRLDDLVVCFYLVSAEYQQNFSILHSPTLLISLLLLKADGGPRRDKSNIDLWQCYASPREGRLVQHQAGAVRADKTVTHSVICLRLRQIWKSTTAASDWVVELHRCSVVTTSYDEA